MLQQKITNFQSNQDGEYRQLQNSYNLMTREYENSKKHLIDYEQSIKKLYSEFERLQIIINELKAERQSLFEKVLVIFILESWAHSRNRKIDSPVKWSRSATGGCETEIVRWSSSAKENKRAYGPNGGFVCRDRKLKTESER